MHAFSHVTTAVGTTSWKKIWMWVSTKCLIWQHSKNFILKVFTSKMRFIAHAACGSDVAHELPICTYCTAPCWSVRTADVNFDGCRRWSWNECSTCAATGCSHRRNRSASWSRLSCSFLGSWTCRTAAFRRGCRNPCRRSGSSLSCESVQTENYILDGHVLPI